MSYVLTCHALLACGCAAAASSSAWAGHPTHTFDSWPPTRRRAAAALAAVVEACKPGAKIVDVCDKGDSLMNE